MSARNKASRLPAPLRAAVLLLAGLALACLHAPARAQTAEPVFDVGGIRAVSDGRALFVSAAGRAQSLGWRAPRLVPAPSGAAAPDGRLDLALVAIPPEGPAAGAMEEVRGSYRHPLAAGSLPSSIAVHAAGNVLELTLQGPGEAVGALRLWCTGSLCDEPPVTTSAALQSRIRQHMAERPAAANGRGGCSPSCGPGEACMKWCTGGGATGTPWQCSWRCVQSGPGGAYPTDPDPGPPSPIDPPPPPQPQPEPPQADPHCMGYCAITCSGLGGGAYAACMSVSVRRTPPVWLPEKPATLRPQRSARAGVRRSG